MQRSPFPRGFGKTLRKLLSKEPPVLDPLDAYQLWAETYDDIEDNALLFAESRGVRPILESHSLENKTILDAGCGTGRYLQLLQSYRPRLLVGFDFSPKMLEQAESKMNGSLVHLNVANVEFLPYKPSTFDFILCTLVLGHVQNLSEAVSQLSATLRSGGTIVSSMFHPFGQLLEWKRTFQAVRKSDNRRKTFAARYYKHLFSEYFNAFSSSGLEITRMCEPILDETLRSFYQKAKRLDLYEKYEGYPLLLVLELRKR
ncbi:MAG: biotin synthase [Bacteroidetes bacterium]|nr:biotin synthase [Bacteroidota bacterium]